jgi:DNA-binding SARP family transcriptional activator
MDAPWPGGDGATVCARKNVAGRRHTLAHTVKRSSARMPDQGSRQAMPLRIQLLGKPRITGADGAVRPVRGHQSWAVLARVLLSERPVDRATLTSELFADTADPLGALRWCLAALRRAIGGDVLSGDPIQPNLPEGSDVDIRELAGGALDMAEAGELLQGIEPKASAAFATWLLIERERIAGRIIARLRQEIMVALSAGDSARAIDLGELAVGRAPLDEGLHVLLVKALVSAGREDAARAHVEATEAFFLDELGEKPTPALRSAARVTISSAPLGVPQRAIVESQISAGIAALSAGAVDAGIDCLRRAAAGAEAVRDNPMLARSLLELGTALVHSVRGYDDEGAIYLRRSVDLARECGAPEIAATGLRELGYLEALAGRRPTAAKLLDDALAASGEDPGRRAGVLAITAYNLVNWGRIAEGLAGYERAIECARSAASRRWEAWSFALGGWGHMMVDAPDVANTWLRESLVGCDATRWLALRPMPLSILATVRLRLDDPPEAVLGDLQDTYALSCQLGDPCWEGLAARSIALTYAKRADYETAERWLVTARERCASVTDPSAAVLVEIMADQMRLAVTAGKPDKARTLARQLIPVAARTHADAHLREAMTLLDGGI